MKPLRSSLRRLGALGCLLLLAGAQSRAANVVNQTWQMQRGDDPRWSSPAYPLSHWRDYNLGISAEHQGGGGETFWLRQMFRIPSAWRGEALRCDVRLLARDVTLYLNGTALPLSWNADRVASFLLPAEQLRAVGEDNHLALRISGSDYTGGVGRDFLTIQPDKKNAPAVALKIGFPPRDHVFSSGTDIRFSVAETLEGADDAAGLLRVEIQNEFHQSVFLLTQPADLARRDSASAVSVPPLAPGFYQVVAAYSAPGIEAQDVQWFAVAPTELRCPDSSPPDLTEYWQRAKAELAAVAPDFAVTLDEGRSTAKHRVYTVAMKSVGGVTLRAWFIVPNKPGQFPAVLHVPGYGGSFKPEWFMNDDDIAHLALDIRGHGRSAEEVHPGWGPPGFVAWNILDPRNYFYRGAYLDCMRAIDFLCTRSEVDAARIAVDGPSQGGGLAIATAALDGRIKCCATAVLFLGDFHHHLQIREAYIPEFDVALKTLGRGTFADVAHTMSYIDTVNLAPWIRCPVLMGSGLFDDDCPPHINFAVFNRIGSPKDYRIYPSRGHDVGPQWGADARAWLRGQFGLPANPESAEPPGAQPPSSS